MAAASTSSASLASALALGGRARHWQYPRRETAGTLHSRLTLYWSRPHTANVSPAMLSCFKFL
ncbi:hypothetical protein BVIET440_110133 [Burkholderia vietnamiensis]